MSLSRWVGVVGAILIGGGSYSVSYAETLMGALAKAYVVNPTLNAQRAATRVTDENVPQALSGWRPTISGSADWGYESRRSRGVGGRVTSHTNPGGVGLTIDQPIFRGFRTVNSTKSAEAQVLAAREELRNSEQNVLFDGISAYMDVIRNKQIVGLRVRNIEFLEEQVRAARDRFSVGEGTRTDVAQSEARLSQSVSELNLARSNLTTAGATYRQVIGEEPRNLKSVKPYAKGLSKNRRGSVDLALQTHPAIISRMHAIDAAAFQVKTIEGELLPSVSVQGSVSRRWESSDSVDQLDDASVVGRLNIPIFQAGSVSSRIRQAKETLGQRRIELDASRDQVRAAVISAWGSLVAAKASIVAAREQVSASKLALEGVIEEQKVGQRTILDVLNQRQELLNAQELLVNAEYTTVRASYSLLSALGRLNAQYLRLRVAVYKPQEHYEKVRDKWFGLRTPDGR